jgi:uncharacterized membrane protein YidH (DUF202 family)
LIRVIQDFAFIPYLQRMNTEMTDKPQPTPEERAKAEEKKLFKQGKKELSLERVRLALERLELGWLRTAMTFVALGFTSYKFYYERVEKHQETIAYVNGRTIGMFLIFVGFLGLLQATLQHRTNWQKLAKYYPGLPYSVSLIQAMFILALTGVLFVMVLFHW